MTSYGDLVCNGTLTAALAAGALLSLLIKSDLRRSRANENALVKQNEATGSPAVIYDGILNAT